MLRSLFLDDPSSPKPSIDDVVLTSHRVVDVEPCDEKHDPSLTNTIVQNDVGLAMTPVRHSSCSSQRLDPQVRCQVTAVMTDASERIGC